MTMFKGFETIKAQLAELAPAINAFKSEAVQLRIVELIFNLEEPEADSVAEGREDRRRRNSKRAKKAASESSVETRGAQNKPGKKKSSRSGTIPTLNQLVDGGFFAKRRT
jgi:hypothetical protein